MKRTQNTDMDKGSRDVCEEESTLSILLILGNKNTTPIALLWSFLSTLCILPSRSSPLRGSVNLASHIKTGRIHAASVVNMATASRSFPFFL